MTDTALWFAAKGRGVSEFFPLSQVEAQLVQQALQPHKQKMANEKEKVNVNYCITRPGQR